MTILKFLVSSLFPFVFVFFNNVAILPDLNQIWKDQSLTDPTLEQEEYIFSFNTLNL